MATLREYYEKDFDHTVRFHVSLPYAGDQVEGSFLYDFASYSVFLSCYFPNILINARYVSGSSPNLIGNQGWPKAEFDAVFTRQILLNEKLFLPIWYNVTKEDVYNYSPGLLNIVGLNYNELGPEETCRKLSIVLNE